MWIGQADTDLAPRFSKGGPMRRRGPGSFRVKHGVGRGGNLPFPQDAGQRTLGAPGCCCAGPGGEGCQLVALDGGYVLVLGCLQSRGSRFSGCVEIQQRERAAGQEYAGVDEQRIAAAQRGAHHGVTVDGAVDAGDRRGVR